MTADVDFESKKVNITLTNNSGVSEEYKNKRPLKLKIIPLMQKRHKRYDFLLY